MSRMKFWISFLVLAVQPAGLYAEPLEGVLNNLPDWSFEAFLHLQLWQWIGIVAAIFIGIVLRVIVYYIMTLIHKIVSKRTKSQWDDKIIDALRGPTGFLFATGFWYLSVSLLRFDPKANTFFYKILSVILGLAIISISYRIVKVFIEFLQELASKTETTLDDQLIPVLSKTLKTLVVGFGVLIIVQNLGINVFSLLAGLGIGGLAFALAAKDTAANFFGSFTIFTDRPFGLGDWVRIGDAEGIVEEIGLRTTRIRTFGKELVIIPNADVSNSKVVNVSRRPVRRVYAVLGLTYDTPPEKMEAFLEGLKNIILAAPYTDKENFHVVFKGFGASSLDVMLYFFQKVNDWGEELMGKQYVWLETMRLAKEIGVDFAYPTQSLHIETFPEKEGVRAPHEFTEDQLKEQAAAFAAQGKLAKPHGLSIFQPPYK